MLKQGKQALSNLNVPSGHVLTQVDAFLYGVRDGAMQLKHVDWFSGWHVRHSFEQFLLISFKVLIDNAKSGN